ncbi:hypothetical protein [Snodgrassella alvi]|uniref:Uncharacterized protein n=1 Tax=Snodgrassella alvi TaxID=1196083 RepID=A0A2N9WR96_9NEIS|nr:hypothetical protein [Snodgrassella alvi]PIT12385.1 hypothetical protein BGI32_10640 [Snodgrassella alvi]PIT15400.1 hypothetical protein BGI33_06305 [Snodgrassella alvi]PIT16823.1 hypothetical protein BGI34_09125 [Snodgrassella alvi]
MYRILCDEDFRIPVAHKKADFTDNNAKKLFKESCYVFKAFKLATEKLIQFGDTVYLLPWKGDKIVNTLFTLLLREKLSVDINAGIITIADTSIEQVKAVLQQLV